MATVVMAIPLDEVIEGMELDADVFDGVGRALVRAGVAVTEKHLRIFRMCGIQDIRIRREVSDEEAKPDPALVQARLEAEAALQPRFRRTNPGDPVIAALFGVCLDRAVTRARWNGASSHA